MATRTTVSNQIAVEEDISSRLYQLTTRANRVGGFGFHAQAVFRRRRSRNHTGASDLASYGDLSRKSGSARQLYPSS